MDLFKKLNDFILTITSRNENFWEQRELNKTNDVRDGTHDTPKYIDSGYPLITSKNLTSSGTINFDDISYISEDDFNFINKRSNVDTNDILFGMIGTIGNPVLVGNDTNFAIKNVALIKKSDSINQYFLINILNSNIFKKYIIKTNQGNTQKFISLSQIRKFTFYAPQLYEQIEIGKILQKIDSVITLYDRKLKLVKLIYKELENKVYNNDLIKQTNFTKVKLGEILKEKNIKSTYEDQYPVLSSTNSGIELRNGRTNSSSNVGYKVLSKNELVLSPQNLWLGNININFNFRNGLVSPSYKVFSLTNNINIIYLNSLLHHPKMMYLYKVVSVQGASVVRRNLDIEAFENLTLKLTSIEAQNKIGNLLNKNRQLIDSLEKKKDQISKIKTTLLNTMFI